MTEKYTTLRIKLSCPDDYSSRAPRGELEQALVQLIITSGVHLNLAGFDYELTACEVVGR